MHNNGAVQATHANTALLFTETDETIDGLCDFSNFRAMKFWKMPVKMVYVKISPQMRSIVFKTQNTTLYYEHNSMIFN